MENLSSQTVLAALRAVVGVIALAAPVLAARAFGVDPYRSNHWITRLFGSRELVLAASLLAAQKQQVYPVAVVGVVIDSLDVVSAVVERARGRISLWTLLFGGGGAAVFAGLGLDAARRAQQHIDHVIGQAGPLR